MHRMGVFLLRGLWQMLAEPAGQENFRAFEPVLLYNDSTMIIKRSSAMGSHGGRPHTPLLIFENGIMWKAGPHGGLKMGEYLLADELIFSGVCGSDRLLCPINRAERLG